MTASTIEALQRPTLNVLRAVFGANRTLCAAAPPQLFSRLLSAHHADLSLAPANPLLSPRSHPSGFVPPPLPADAAAVAAARLRLLIELIRPAGWPLRGSQERVLAALLADDAPLRVGVDVTDGEYARRRVAVAAAAAAGGASADSEHSGSEAPRGRWHLHGVELLAACCEGRSKSLEGHCRAAYPLAALLHAALDVTNVQPLRAALMRLLRHAYVDSDQPPAGLHADPQLLQLVRLLHTELRAVQWKLPTRALRDAYAPVLRLGLTAAVPLLASLLERAPPEVEPQVRSPVMGGEGGEHWVAVGNRR